MHSKNEIIEIMMNAESDKVIEELFELLLKRYQNNQIIKFFYLCIINYCFINYCIINVIKNI